MQAARVQTSGRTGSGRVAHLWPVGQGWTGFNRFELEVAVDRSVLTAAQVAWHSGVSEPQLLRWIDGVEEPTLSEVEAVAAALGDRVDLFYSGFTPRTVDRYTTDGEHLYDLSGLDNPDDQDNPVGGQVIFFPTPSTTGQDLLPGL